MHATPSVLVSLVVALSGACALALVRARRRAPQDLYIWLGDALSIGTLWVLVLIVLDAASPVELPWLKQATSENAFLIVVAYVFCGISIANAIRKSLKPQS